MRHVDPVSLKPASMPDDSTGEPSPTRTTSDPPANLPRMASPRAWPRFGAYTGAISPLGTRSPRPPNPSEVPPIRSFPGGSGTAPLARTIHEPPVGFASIGLVRRMAMTGGVLAAQSADQRPAQSVQAVSSTTLSSQGMDSPQACFHSCAIPPRRSTGLESVPPAVGVKVVAASFV